MQHKIGRTSADGPVELDVALKVVSAGLGTSFSLSAEVANVSCALFVDSIEFEIRVKPCGFKVGKHKEAPRALYVSSQLVLLL